MLHHQADEAVTVENKVAAPAGDVADDSVHATDLK